MNHLTVEQGFFSLFFKCTFSSPVKKY